MMSPEMIANVKGALEAYHSALENKSGVKVARDKLTNLLMNYADHMIESAEYTEKLVEELAKLATENAELKRKAKPKKDEPAEKSDKE